MPERTPDSTPAAAALDAADPYQRERQTFPTFDDDQIARARDYGCVERMAAGTVLFSHGERSVDFFLVLAGSMVMDIEGEASRTVGAGELFVVPKGVTHRPRAESECHVLLIEPKGEPNTGDPATAASKPRL
mgnify:CR=1 FL=1